MCEFQSLTATVSEICGGQTNVPILVVGYRLAQIRLTFDPGSAVSNALIGLFLQVVEHDPGYHRCQQYRFRA